MVSVLVVTLCLLIAGYVIFDILDFTTADPIIDTLVKSDMPIYTPVEPNVTPVSTLTEITADKVEVMAIILDSPTPESPVS